MGSQFILTNTLSSFKKAIEINMSILTDPEFRAIANPVDWDDWLNWFIKQYNMFLNGVLGTSAFYNQLKSLNDFFIQKGQIPKEFLIRFPKERPVFTESKDRVKQNGTAGGGGRILHSDPTFFAKRYCEKCNESKVTSDYFCPRCGGKLIIRKKPTAKKALDPQQDTTRKIRLPPKKRAGLPFYCQVDSATHPATDRAYRCEKCLRFVCHNCYQDLVASHRRLCPMCDGELLPFSLE